MCGFSVGIFRSVVLIGADGGNHGLGCTGHLSSPRRYKISTEIIQGEDRCGLFRVASERCEW